MSRRKSGADDARERRSVDRHRDPYAKRRREQEERRQREERDQLEPPSPDDWTAPDDSGAGLRRLSRPDQLGDLLPDVIARHGWSDRLEASTVVVRWEQIVGAELAKRCEAVRVAGGTLVVRAIDQTWATQLKYMTRQLVERANTVIGRDVVREVRIIVGPLEQQGS